jgi:hypothetical protein
MITMKESRIIKLLESGIVAMQENSDQRQQLLIPEPEHGALPWSWIRIMKSNSREEMQMHLQYERFGQYPYSLAGRRLREIPGSTNHDTTAPDQGWNFHMTL